MRKIIHCDADCFFAAVEMRDNPSLRDIPLAITGSLSNRGVISTCNYEARRSGVRSAMPTWQARSLCPDLTLVPHNMEKYREASLAINRIFHEYTEDVEKVSLDEAYLDVSDSQRHQGSATLLAAEIRRQVKAQVGITVSAGVAPNKFLAKIASEWRKPDGLYTIPPENVDLFLQDLPIQYIQGVGKKTAQKINNQGIYTCGDLQKWSKVELINRHGRFGIKLYELARGIDKRPIAPARFRKSLSVEHTFGEDLSYLYECKRELKALHEKLISRLKNLPANYTVKKLQAKIKFSDFSQTTIETCSSIPALANFIQLTRQGLDRTDLPVRLLGIGVQFSESDPLAPIVNQLPLFDHNSPPAIMAH